MQLLDPGPPPSVDSTKPLAKLSQLAYQRFKEALFAQNIATGATLTQGDLVRLLDVPLGPLREALQVLESEGLVTMLPRAGIRIVKPDMALIKDCFQLRRILECEAVRKYADRAPAQEMANWIARHRTIIARVETGASEPELFEAARAVDQSFHAMLIAALRNPLIDDVYTKIKDRIRLVRLDNLYMLSAVTVERTMQEHLRVLQALAARDTDAAVRAMEDHLAAALHRAIGF
jgi:DNA-binding GntR family transcriptional regulator